MYFSFMGWISINIMFMIFAFIFQEICWVSNNSSDFSFSQVNNTILDLLNNTILDFLNSRKTIITQLSNHEWEQSSLVAIHECRWTHQYYSRKITPLGITN